MQFTKADTLENLRFDYQQTIDYIKLLTDIRFRLLVFTPVISGITLAFSEYILARNYGILFIIGILGFVSTLGIIIYDQRNSQIYDKAIERATYLERMLNFPLVRTNERYGGLFNERPARDKELLGLILIWHDRGLALVYGASLCGWSFLIVNSLANTIFFTKIWSTSGIIGISSVILSVIIGLIFINDLHKQDRYMLITRIGTKLRTKFSEIIDKRHPHSERAWNNKGLALYNKGKYDDAIKCFVKTIELKSKRSGAWNYAMTWNNKGLALYNKALYNKGKYDDAITAYDEAIRLDPNYAMAMNGKGAIFFKTRDYDDALTTYEKAITHDPELAMAWNGKGATLVEQRNDYEKAIKCFDEAIGLDPKYASAWNNKGAALGYQGDYEGAIKCFDEAIRLDPKYASAWNNKGEALRAFGRTSNVAFAKAKELGYEG